MCLKHLGPKNSEIPTKLQIEGEGILLLAIRAKA